MAMLLPELIRTPRLTLREPCDADAGYLFDAYTQDPEVARYMVWRPHRSVSETEAFISYCKQEWTSGRRRPYILARSDNEGIPIGMLEARIFSGTIDLGYVLQRSCWGTGLMTEALIALANAALALPECFRVQATCDTENHASARVLEKSGFAREDRLDRHMVLPNLGAEPRASLMYARCR
jgi:ribosomal-protein-alanine N-acetyltransferase